MNYGENFRRNRLSTWAETLRINFSDLIFLLRYLGLLKKNELSIISILCHSSVMFNILESVFIAMSYIFLVFFFHKFHPHLTFIISLYSCSHLYSPHEHIVSVFSLVCHIWFLLYNFSERLIVEFITFQ